MRKSKIIKKRIYKTDSPRERTYTQLANGQIIADLQRTVYQQTKKECRNMTRKQVMEYLSKKG